LRELLTGEVARGPCQVVIAKVLEVFAEQAGLFEFLRGRRYSLSRPRELFERVRWNVR
jgi:hypothetical protein